MRPSSSSSDDLSPGGGLFSGVLERGAARSLTSDDAWLAALVEAALAVVTAQARIGMIDGTDAEAIVRACRGATLDAGEIGREAADSGTPVLPVIERLRALAGDKLAGAILRGTTSQDLVDTATMLVARRALGAILADLDAAADAAAALAARHRATPMVGRTLLQQALPTTFGLKAAGWMSGLDRAAGDLRHVRSMGLAVQLGGATGTLAAFGDEGRALVAAYGEELGLQAPVVPWHTERTRIGALASALGVAAGAVAKPARDVVLLAQTEVREVGEGVASRGASSAMPHKRNPVAAVSAVAAAARAPGLVATLLASMAQEHERAAGAWHAEWLPLRDLLVSVGSAAAWLRDCLEKLTVDEAAMRANLGRTGGLILAERVVEALVPLLGRAAARELVAASVADTVASGRPFAEALRARLPPAAAIDGPRLDGPRLDALLDPTTYLGSAMALVDDALMVHERAREER